MLRIDAPMNFVRAIVLWAEGSRKGGVIQRLHGLPFSSVDEAIERPTTSCSVSKITLNDSGHAVAAQGGDETTVHLILTEVPASYASDSAGKRDLRNKLAILLGRNE